MIKNKYIKIIVTFLTFSIIIANISPVFYENNYVLSAENEGDKKNNGETKQGEDSKDEKSQNENNTDNKAIEKDKNPEEKMTSGSLNSGFINWNYINGILSFTGTGIIPSFDNTHKTQPWVLYAEEITEINISEGITGVGNYAFDNLVSLVKVTATENLKSIGACSFPGKRDITFFAPFNSYVLNYAKRNYYNYSATTFSKYNVYFKNTTSVIFEPKTVAYGDYFGELPAPVLEGYNFLGWYTSRMGGTKITSDSKMESESDVYLYAHWEKKPKKQYKVNFITLTSETFSPVTVVYGDYFGKLPIPSAKGYNFLGWYTSATGGVNVASYSKVEIESDIYLYARWEKKKYKVEFNDNYTSTVFPQDKTVSEGEEFGVLPEPQREGYKFLGWFAYTDTYKEYQVNYATKFYSSYSYQTTVSLFAKWERAQYIITFEPAGGVVEGVGGVNIKNVSYGLLYGSLPTPVRDGYEFQGWFTAAEGGEEVNSYTLVPALTSYYQTLYAHWEKIKVEEYRVTFNPDGGHLNKEEKNKTIVFGREYGILPIPSRKGYSFDGWFTKKKGGKKIYGNNIYNLHSDITLYARWTSLSKTVYKAKFLKELSYNFENSYEGFGYNYGYKIPLACFQFMFGKTELARLLYTYDGYWAGNCYGMAATSGMFYSKNIIKPSAFKKGAKFPSDLKLNNKNMAKNMNLRRFIEIMQISQYNQSVQNVYNKNANKLTKIVSEVKKFQKSGKSPVIVAISGRSGAHAVIGYAVEDGKNGTGKLYVYDPNFPNAKRYITLYKNEAGNYTGWYYLMSNTYNWGNNYGGTITYIPGKEYANIWKKQDKKKLASNILFTDTDNAVIYDENKKVAAILKDGMLLSENKNINKIWDFKVSETPNIKISIPEGIYTVRNTGKKKNFTVAMAGTFLGTEITTMSDRVVMAIDESRKICMADELNKNICWPVYASVKGIDSHISITVN